MNKSFFKESRIFLLLQSFSLLFFSLISILFCWLISDKLFSFNNFLAYSVFSVFGIILILLMFGFLAIFYSYRKRKKINIPGKFINIILRIYLPVIYLFGNLFKINKEKIRNSFIALNNSLILNNQVKFKSEDVLILLPHCIQVNSCEIRVTSDISNCIKCGRCIIKDILDIKEKYDIDVRIVTGGTLARRIVIEKRPKFIIAVACQRDLVSGIKDIFPLESFGIINTRPNGPCIDTTFAIEELKNIIKEKVIQD